MRYLIQKVKVGSKKSSKNNAVFSIVILNEHKTCVMKYCTVHCSATLVINACC